jgi:hypothetical protein
LLISEIFVVGPQTLIRVLIQTLNPAIPPAYKIPLFVILATISTLFLVFQALNFNDLLPMRAQIPQHTLQMFYSTPIALLSVVLNFVKKCANTLAIKLFRSEHFVVSLAYIYRLPNSMITVKGF